MTEAEELELLELEEEEARSIQPAPGPSAWESVKQTAGDVGHKLLQGYTKNWSDEAIGGIGNLAMPDDAGIRTTSGGVTAPGESVYRPMRDSERARLALASKRNPWTSGIAEAAGQIGSDVTAQLLGVPGVTALPYQVASGALSGAGSSGAELRDNPGEVALDAGIGGALSAGTYGLSRVAGAAVRPFATRLKGALQDFAGERAIKATGAIQGDIKGVPADRLRQMGRQLIDQGVITAGVAKDTVLDRSQEALERSGAAIGGILERADAAAQATRSGAFNWRPVLQRLQTEVFTPLTAAGRRGAASALGFAMDIVEEAKAGSGYAVANRLKGDIQKGINWKTETGLATGTAKKIQGILDDEIEKQISGSLGGQVADEFMAAKSLFGAFKTAESGATKGLWRQMGNRFTSPSDMGMGMAQYASDAAASGGDELMSIGKAGVVSLLHKIARERGASVAAVGAHSLAKSSAISRLMRTNPQALGRFSTPLLEALKSGDEQGLAVQDYVLSQSNSEYRKAKEDALKQLPDEEEPP